MASAGADDMALGNADFNVERDMPHAMPSPPRLYPHSLLGSCRAAGWAAPHPLLHLPSDKGVRLALRS